jgi:hypothetical protein
MYEDILGSGFSAPTWVTAGATALYYASLWVMVLMIFLALINVKMAGFSNMEDTIKSKHDQTASLPVLDERSLRQKLGEAEQRAKDAMAAASAPVSTLTGTRDIPVFYQDYDIDVVKKNGAVAQAREGFTGALSQDDLESMLLKNKN